jgi:hypothetical protein
MSGRASPQEPVDVKNAEREYEGVDSAEDDKRASCLPRRQERCNCLGGSQDPIDDPGLAAHFRRVPAGQEGNEGQGEAQKDEPKEKTTLRDAAFDAQVGSKPGNGEHNQSTPDHDSEREERNDYRGTVLGRKVGQADLFGGETHARDQATENRDLDLIMIGLCRRIGDRNQDFSGRLLVVPAPLDGGKFRRLVRKRPGGRQVDGMSACDESTDNFRREVLPRVIAEPLYGLRRDLL